MYCNQGKKIISEVHRRIRLEQARDDGFTRLEIFVVEEFVPRTVIAGSR